MDSTNEQRADPALAATGFIDSDHPAVVAFAREVAGDAEDRVEQARRLYVAVRDRIRYDPYAMGLVPEIYVASAVLAAGRGYCIPKAILLCAAARAVGIRARLGFADVRNHLNTERLRALMGSDEFRYHGFTALELGGRWVKVTPTFNRELCARFGVEAMEFDGEHDALLHACDGAGRRHMEYIRDHGLFDDFPFERVRDALANEYPRLFAAIEGGHRARFDDERPLG